MRYTEVVVGRIRKPTRGERVVAFLVRWAMLAVAVWLAAEIVDGIHLGGWQSTLVVALILGLLNALLRPILFWISLPLTIITFGLFLIVLNAIMLWFTDWIAGHFDDLEFQIDEFWWDAIWGALIISLVTWVIGWFVKPERVARTVAR